jgi:hypothetical protein
MTHQWPKPPIWSVTAAMLLLALGATAGGSLVFQDRFYAFARPIVRARPAVHGLTDVPAIDEAKITEAVEQSNRAFRMLHVHGLGVGVLILVAATAAAQLPVPRWARGSLTILITLGALYPPGWLLFGLLIPFYGFDALRAPIEYGVFLPFGGAAIVGLWGTGVGYLLWWVRGRAEATVPQEA